MGVNSDIWCYSDYFNKYGKHKHPICNLINIITKNITSMQAIIKRSLSQTFYVVWTLQYLCYGLTFHYNDGIIFDHDDDKINECKLSNTQNSPTALIRTEFVVNFRSKTWRVGVDTVPFLSILSQTGQGMGTEPCGLDNVFPPEELSFLFGDSDSMIYII